MNLAKLAVAAAIVSVHIAAFAGFSCPLDSMPAHFTGNTRTDGATGKLLYEHRCPNNHVFWTTSS